MWDTASRASGDAEQRILRHAGGACEISDRLSVEGGLHSGSVAPHTLLFTISETCGPGTNYLTSQLNALKARLTLPSFVFIIEREGEGEPAYCYASFLPRRAS